jgi:hypothetical protein
MFYHSADGNKWTSVGQSSLDLTDFHHNVHGGFLNLRTGIYAFGEGNAVFDNFYYKKESK